MSVCVCVCFRVCTVIGSQIIWVFERMEDLDFDLELWVNELQEQTRNSGLTFQACLSSRMSQNALGVLSSIWYVVGLFLCVIYGV